MSAIVVRNFKEQNWSGMVRFYKQFYREDYIFTNRRFFDWSFSSPLNPKEESSQHLLMDGSKIIGIMGALPWPLQFGSERTTGEYNINLLIDPQYRGQNMGQLLLDAVSTEYQHSLTNGFHPRTLSIYQRMGSVYHWPMFRFIKCLSEEDTLKLLSTSPHFTSLDSLAQEQAIARLRESGAISAKTQIAMEKIARFGPEWDEAWDRISNGYGFTTHRSSHFLNWRYIDYPFPLYQCHVAKVGEVIVGLLVTRQERFSAGTVIRIVDLVCHESALFDMLGFIEQLSRENHALFIDYIAGGKIDENLLNRAGYCRLEDPKRRSLLPIDFCPIRYRDSFETLIMFLNPKDEKRRYFQENNFYVTKGDGDQDRAN